uniref:Uncharacterized protein n=1 Tax=Glossina pallidipes TaxID=7398 RepID=A0A1B0AIG7_GLOPL
MCGCRLHCCQEAEAVLAVAGGGGGPVVLLGVVLALKGTPLRMAAFKSSELTVAVLPPNPAAAAAI